MDINKLMTAAFKRIVDDYAIKQYWTMIPPVLPEAESYHPLPLPLQIVKGSRKRKGMKNPCFTISVPSNPQNEDTKAHNGTMIINFFADNYPEGHAHVELLGPVADRLEKIFDDQPLDLDGYKNYNLVVDAVEGPLWDPDDPDEHFMSVRIKFGIIEEG